MTEAEWWIGEAPARMLDYIQGHATARQKRLFGCACCHRVYLLLPEPPYWGAVQVAE
jgi:hypothetical protein